MKNGIIVIGAGGHAKVCIEILEEMGEAVAFCIGNVSGDATCVGIPVLSGDENMAILRASGYSRAFIAIGSNALRARLGEAALKLGYSLVNAISSHAVVSGSACFGHGIAVMPGVIINAETAISDLAIINTGATVDHDCRIGIAAHVGPQCGLAGNVIVGAQTFLGIGCKVIPGVEIGDTVTIGAGAVVTTNIKSNVTAVGVPARIIRNLQQQ